MLLSSNEYHTHVNMEFRRVSSCRRFQQVGPRPARAHTRRTGGEGEVAGVMLVQESQPDGLTAGAAAAGEKSVAEERLAAAGWGAMEDMLVARAQRAEEKLLRALEREQALRMELESQAAADRALHRRLDLNVGGLDKNVAELKARLAERERGLSRAERLAERLEQQNATLKAQLEAANQKLDDHAELERMHRRKMQEMLVQVQNVDQDKAELQKTLNLAFAKEREGLQQERDALKENLTTQLTLKEEELQAAQDTVAFADATLLQGELDKATKRLEEMESTESLLRREVQQRNMQLKHNAQQMKDLEGQVEEVRQIWQKNLSELNEAKLHVSRCDDLQKELLTVQEELKGAVMRADGAQRTCAALSDVLVSVTQHVKAASESAQDENQVVMQEIASFFEDSSASSPGQSASAAHSIPASFMRMKTLLDPLWTKPTVSAALREVVTDDETTCPNYLKDVQNSIQQLGQHIQLRQETAHQRFYQILQINSVLLRALDRAEFELHGCHAAVAPKPVPEPAPEERSASDPSTAGASDANAATGCKKTVQGNSDSVPKTLEEVADTLSTLAANAKGEYVQASPTDLKGCASLPSLSAPAVSPSLAPPAGDSVRGVATPPAHGGDWGVEGELLTLSPVLSDVSGSIRNEGGSGSRGRGARGLEHVFKSLEHMIDEGGAEQQGIGARAGGGRHESDEETVVVAKVVINSYREQMAQLERGLAAMQTMYVRKETVAAEVRMCLFVRVYEGARLRPGIRRDRRQTESCGGPGGMPDGPENGSQMHVDIHVSAHTGARTHAQN